MSLKTYSFYHLLTNDKWIIEEIELDIDTDRYYFTATHDNGEVVKMSEDAKKVKQIIQKINDEFE